MSYVVYKHECPNKKVYIGITGKNPKERWINGKGYCSNKHFTNAIKKYGWDNIKHEILFYNMTKEEAEQKEIELIKTYDSTNIMCGYNKSIGGRCISLGCKRTTKTKEKLSLSNKGRKRTEQQRENIRVNAREKNGKPVVQMIDEEIYLHKFPDDYKYRYYDVEIKETRRNFTYILTRRENVIFNSIGQDHEITGASKTTIVKYCKRRYKEEGKSTWMFYEDYLKWKNGTLPRRYINRRLIKQLY